MKENAYMPDRPGLSAVSSSIFSVNLLTIVVLLFVAGMVIWILLRNRKD